MISSIVTPKPTMDALLVHGAPYGVHAGPKYGAYPVSTKTYRPPIYQPQVTVRNMPPFPSLAP